MRQFLYLLASASFFALGACATTAATTGELGSLANPVLADMPPGQQAYLRRLRCADGSTPDFSRNGSVEIIHGRHVIDAFSVRCAGKAAQVVHIDMYHPGHVETTPPAGFTILSDK